MKKTRLLERLRHTRSSGRAFVIEHWEEINEALRAGYSKKDVHAELVNDGLSLSYEQFARITKDLDDETPKPPVSESAVAPAPKPDIQPAPPPTQAQKPEKKTPAAGSKPSDKSPDGTADKQAKGQNRRFKFNPRSNEEDLI